MSITKAISADNQLVQGVIILVLNVFTSVQEIITKSVEFGEVESLKLQQKIKKK